MLHFPLEESRFPSCGLRMQWSLCSCYYDMIIDAQGRDNAYGVNPDETVHASIGNHTASGCVCIRHLAAP